MCIVYSSLKKKIDKDISVLFFKLNDDYELSEFGAVLDEKRLPFGLKYSNLSDILGMNFLCDQF